MPSLGADIETGTLIQWLVKPGDRIKRGDIVAVVETEKGAIEIEVFQNGILQSIVVQEGEKVPVGTTMALIAADGEAPAPAPPKPQPITAARRSAAATRTPAPLPARPSTAASRGHAVSSSRRLLRRAACVSRRWRCALPWSSASIQQP